MILRALGCSGSEAPGQHHMSLLIGGQTLVDMGSAASALSLSEQARIRDILLTHAHLDHTKDLGFFAESVFGISAEPVRVMATGETLDRVSEHLLNGEIWPDFTKLPSTESPVLSYSPLQTGRWVDLAGFRVLPIDVPHIPGSVAYLFCSGSGAVLFSGDTGPTEELWTRLNELEEDLRAVLIEVSFPNRLQALADLSRHHTPQTMAGELEKLDRKDVPVYVHHLKAPTRQETIAELEALGDDRIRLLEPDTNIEF